MKGNPITCAYLIFVRDFDFAATAAPPLLLLQPAIYLLATALGAGMVQPHEGQHLQRRKTMRMAPQSFSACEMVSAAAAAAAAAPTAAVTAAN
jgi:hypothetical protein